MHEKKAFQISLQCNLSLFPPPENPPCPSLHLVFFVLMLFKQHTFCQVAYQQEAYEWPSLKVPKGQFEIFNKTFFNTKQIL